MMTDPISDMLTRIRNANNAYHEEVDIPASKVKEALARILKKYGYVKDFKLIKTGPQGVIRVALKYGPKREKAIMGLKRVSKPGLRIYVKCDDIPKVYGGKGKSIVSTSYGIIAGDEAKKRNAGGELLCYIW